MTGGTFEGRDEAALEMGRARLAGVYREHRLHLVVFARRLVGSPDEAEDVVQSVFVRILSRPCGVRRLATAYLHRAVRNAARNHWKRERRRAAGVRAWAQTGSFRRSDPDRDLRWNRAAAALAGALVQLPPAQRAVLELAYRRGMSVGAIAEELGGSPSSVAKAISRARRQLREVVERRGMWLPDNGSR